ncbi:uncharacterized protein PHALS_08172 [Plasmopara halstedii]|uniref:Uncharacterized protein n=1 Tax=Plasmopara halstedii TaxID=4781 RepID=A0A0P1ACV8_PLAHL|nr:uncharacterized protein PHALS_08172 [Plasmopara halstedii]CEG38077.1 hypothetical protein PHALS_08172 [Plasmopara halstedii]|eukprot:XP_024574446.1 hypothetical protein PHALS_08172 [Plasmopara halstedii]
MFQERDRTPDQIERRVKYLKLHRKTHDSSDEDDNKISDSVGDDFGDVEKKSVRESRLEKDLATLDTAHPRRRLRRGARLSDEESDDEIFLGREADPSLVTSKTTSEVTKAVNGALNATSDPKDDVETQVHIDSSNLSLHNQTKQSFISQEPETSLATDTSSNKPGKEAEEDEVLAGMNLVEINGSQKDVLLKDIAPQSRKRKRDSEEHEVISDMQPKTNLTQG